MQRSKFHDAKNFKFTNSEARGCEVPRFFYASS